MDPNTGIFIHTKEDDIELIVKSCKEMLKLFGMDSIKIVRVIYDENNHGFKVFFSDASVVLKFLKRKCLSYIEKQAFIYPLTTELIVETVRNGYPDDEERFKKSIKDELEKKFSRPILNIIFVPVSSGYSDMKYGDWLVELDIPEIEALNVIRKSDSPDYMLLLLQVQRENEEIRASLRCSICKKINHLRINCSNDPTPNSIETSKVSASSLPIKNTSSSRGQTKIDELLSKRPLNENDSESSRKRVSNFYRSDVNNDSGNNNSVKEGIANRPETDFDGLQVDFNMLQEDTNEPQLSYQMNCDPSGYASDDSNACGELEENTTAPSKIPTSTKIVIPDKIKEIVLNRKKQEGELDIKELEAFCNHAKQKINIVNIAKQYTTNIDRFKEQLKRIIKDYYMSDPGNKEDCNFINNRLQVFLDKFDPKEKIDRNDPKEKNN